MAYVQNVADQNPGADSAFFPCRANATFRIDSTPTVTVAGSLLGPSVVAAGTQSSYRWSVDHTAASTSDLTDAVVYDLLGRDGTTGAPIGQVAARFVSASPASPGTLSYTCDPAPTYATAASLTWVPRPTDAPCAGPATVTALRYRLDSTSNPAGNPGYYAITDPPAVLNVTVAMPDTARDGERFVVQARATSTQLTEVLSTALSVTADSNADLSIDLSSDAEPVRSAPTTVTVTVSNTGPDATVAPVVVTLTAPPGTVANAAASGNAEWSCVASTATLTCTRASRLPVGSDVTFPAVFDVVANPPPVLVVDASVTSTHTDPNPDNNSAIVRLTLDLPPSVLADQVSTRALQTVTIDILDNDTGSSAAIDPGTVSHLPGTEPGYLRPEQVSFDPLTGAATVLPLPEGSYRFRYRVCDSNRPVALCGEASVTLAVSAAPVANDDAVTTPYRRAVDVPLLANDAPTDGFPWDVDTLTVDNPARGTADRTGGVVRYTPDDDFVGRDQFAYRLCDVGPPVLCVSGRVVVDVAPDAVDDTEAGTAGTPVTLDPVGNDAAPSDYTISVAPTAGGTVVVNPDRTVTFRADDGAIGTIRLNYTLCDTVTRLCDTAQITLVISAPLPSIGTITGLVAIDDNGDGRAQEAESVGGVRITAVHAGPDGELGTSDDLTLPTATTGSPFVIANVPLGRVRVAPDRATLPTGLRPFSDSDGGDDLVVILDLTRPEAYRADFLLRRFGVTSPPAPSGTPTTAPPLAEETSDETAGLPATGGSAVQLGLAALVLIGLGVTLVGGRHVARRRLDPPCR